uniref:Uncharacterized protein n=1 Tax=Alexandrium monilatum TaxID=311494 RepID=A0A7S4VJP4_9DINO|mmetsp:Transcript_23134/g.72779  ORF Transcript_23134/g.72779 Transcript_23134/m.72779 type:complete len:231 (+) Transcript_23134:74-766(+)
MAEEPGWQWRLCATLCAPPIASVRFAHRTPLSQRELPQLEKGAILCLGLGLVRSCLNVKASLNDFMSGGTDLFTGILGLCAVHDVCLMNGSFLAMFVLWSMVNAILFDLVFSLGPNLVYPSQYWSSDARIAAFVADNILILVSAALQVKLCGKAKAILDDVLPNWRDQVVYGSSGAPPPGSAVDQPLLGRPPATVARTVQPSGSGASQPFRAFGGSGQRLGGGSGERRLV